MKKLLITVCVLLCVCFLFSGCSVISFDSSEIMRPPHATGDKAEIQDIIEETAGSGYTLKYPQRGKNKNAITMFDIDNDSVEESVAFYQTANETDSISILIIDEINGEWKAVGNYKHAANEVDRIEFADLNGDGSYEVVAGWSIATGMFNNITAYFVHGTDVFEAVCDDKYIDFVIGSFSGDQKANEIMLLSLFSGDEQATAKLISCKETDAPVFVISSSVGLNNEIVYYDNIIYGKISTDQYGVVIDGSTITGDYNTQVIYYNKNISSLVNSYYSLSETTPSKTLRSEMVFSSDIDNDEIIEIPIAVKMEKELNEKEETVATQICWSQYIIESNSFLANQTVVINNTYGYSLTMPDSWLGKVTARIDNTAGTLTFYEWVLKKNSYVKGDILLTVKVFDAKSFMEENTDDGYVLVAKNNSYAYTYKQSDTKNPLVLDEKTIQGMFVILNQ